MIKVNLIPGERRGNFTEFAGIKLNLINIKLLIPFFLAVYLVEPVIENIYSGDIEKFEEQAKNNRKSMAELRIESRKYDNIRNQVKQLNQQEKNLATKIKVVQEIVEKRQNPFKVLKYIAENIPGDVWLTELEVEEKKLKILGYSKSWKSIGEFIENLKTSIFFNGTVNYVRPEGMQSNIGNNRVETFEITTSIVSF